MKFLIRFRRTVMFLVKLLIVAAMTAGFINSWYNNYTDTIFSFKGNYVVIISYLFVFLLFAELYGGFKIGVSRLHEIIYSLSLSAFFTNVLMYTELSLIAREPLYFPPYLSGFVYQIIVIFIGSYCANSIYFRLYKARKMLAVFADDEEGKLVIRKMTKIPERFDITRGVSVNRSTLEETKKLIDGFEAILVCDVPREIKNELIRYCYANRKRTYVLPSSTDIIVRNADQIQVFDTPMLFCRNMGLRLEQEIVKRFFDILFSLIGIILFSPVFIIVSLAIKICDGGPIFFKQNRVTKNGKIFNVLKFRSMVVDADKEGAKKAENSDKRITAIGKIIRPCRIDELPQLFNILFGDMSLVGPRPERIENVYEYTNKYPDFDLRHRVKGGLTGYAQIYGKYNTSPEDKLNLDLIYIEQYSLFLDFKLLLMTVKILFMKESTEGFDKSANANVKKSKSLKNCEETEK